MSFRELRNFTETMKALGYPRQISVENFRTPNFQLVADALYWLVMRYDPTAEVDADISTEIHRVEFLKAVATVMMSKARVKLNIKQLYRADAYAVKELLKLSSLLYDAIQLDSAAAGDQATDEDIARMQADADVSLAQKLEELKEARNLATELVESGQKLHGLLGREAEVRESRERAMHFLDALSSNLSSDDPQQLIESRIREQVAVLHDNVAELQRLRAEAEANAKTLRSKIERRQTELERAEKRLKSLRKVKPAFSEEFANMEGELKLVYDAYLERFRNLHYLESELERYRAAEREKKVESDRALKRMQKRLREEEMRILRGDAPIDDADLDGEEVWDSGRDDSSDASEDSDSSDDGRRRSMRRKKPHGSRPAGRAAGRAVGSMAGGDSDDSDDSDDDSDEDDDEDSHDDSDDDHSLGVGGRGGLGGRGGGGGGSDSDDLDDSDDLHDSDEAGGGARNGRLNPAAGRAPPGHGADQLGLGRGLSADDSDEDDDDEEDESDHDDDDDEPF